MSASRCTLATGDRLLHVAKDLQLNVRRERPGGLGRDESVSPGAGYLLRRNVRIFAEGTWD